MLQNNDLVFTFVHIFGGGGGGGDCILARRKRRRRLHSKQGENDLMAQKFVECTASEATVTRPKTTILIVCVSCFDSKNRAAVALLWIVAAVCSENSFNFNFATT